MTTLHQDGLLDLSFKRSPSGKTVLQTQSQRFPLRITVPLYIDTGDPSMAFIYVQNPTGAIIAGDRLLTSITTAPGSRVHLTTQSATKLHAMEGGTSEQKMLFSLGENSFVEYLPDMLIPQAGSRLSQNVTIELSPGACFIGADTISPGRRLSGELFKYEELDFETTIKLDGNILSSDRLRLRPDDDHLQQLGALGNRPYLVTLIAAAPGRNTEALASRIDHALAAEPSVHGAAGELPNGAGALARALATDKAGADRALRVAWEAARSELLGLALPRERK